MSPLNTSLCYSYFLDIAPITIGGLLLYTGIRCFQDPQALADFFGLPSATADEVIFFQSSTGRNIAACIFIWILTYMRERKILGIFFLCWTWAGISDIKLLWEHPRGEKAGMHIRNIVVLVILGTLLIRAGGSR